MVPDFFGVQQVQGQRLRDPGDGGAAAAVALAGSLARAPGGRPSVFVGTPRVRAASVVAADPGDFIYAGVAGEKHLRAGPGVAVGGLLIFAEAGFGERFINVGELLVAEEQSGEDDGQLAAAAVSAPAVPAGMPGADHAAEVNADLDEINEERFFLLGREVGAQEQGRIADDAADLAAVPGHVVGRFLESEVAGIDPRAARPADVLLDGFAISGPSSYSTQICVTWRCFISSWIHCQCASMAASTFSENTSDPRTDFKNKALADHQAQTRGCIAALPTDETCDRADPMQTSWSSGPVAR